MAASDLTDFGGDSLFKTVFSGLVLREYEARRLFAPLVTTRQVTRGKAVDFSLLGTVAPVYHTPGDNVILDNSHLKDVLHAKVTVTLNDKLIASTMVDELAELKNDFPARAELAAEMGRAIADREDRLIAQAITMAALGRRNGSASPNEMYAGEPAAGGYAVVADGGTDAVTRENLLNALFSAATSLDEANVPEDDRYFAVHPSYFHHLARNTDVLNKDWGGSGVFADNKVFRVAGFSVIKSTNIPKITADAAGLAGERNDLDFDPQNIQSGAGNAGQLWGLCFHKGAAAVAKGMDMRTEVEYKTEYQGTLILASNVMGAAALRRQSAVIIAADD